jgi:HlyD family secretion protein
MIGSVRAVSRFPVTTDAVTNVVGNAEVARRLTAGGNKIEVSSELELDSSSPTGFRWTSGTGPAGEITAGTTVSVRTTIESRRPISYVIPLLRRGSGS